MEQKHYCDYYLPFAASRLMEYKDLLEKVCAPASRYKKPDRDQAIFLNLLVKLTAISEEFLGPTLAFESGTVNQAIPKKWTSIINYLKREKFIEGLFFKPLFYDEPILFHTFISSHFNQKLAGTDGNNPRHTIFAHGRALDLEESIAKCIGEFLERFPLLIYKEKNLLRASMQDLERNNKIFLNIEKLAGFSTEQQAANYNLQFDKSSNFFWAEGKSLFSQQSVLIPAQLIFWNYNHIHQNWQEPKLREFNTNGASGHYTLDEALIAGIYELIQRDGFLIYWLNHQSPPKISTESIENQQLRIFIEECRRLDFEVEFYNTTTEIGVPSCICCLIDQSAVGPVISVGGGCSFNWDKTLMQSLIEAVGIYHWTLGRWRKKEEKHFNIDENYQPFRDPRIDQAGRIDFWGDKKMVKNFQFFRDGQEVSLAELKKSSIQFFRPKEELSYLVKIFKRLGDDYEIYYYQAKHQALNDFGYISVKVVIPPLVQLYLNESNAPLGACRLKEVPKKLGFNAAEKLNPWPHPFP